MKLKARDIIGMRILSNGTIYEASEAELYLSRKGQQHVWPATYSFEMTNFTINYLNGSSNMFDAAGTGRAYITCDVVVSYDGDVVETCYGELFVPQTAGSSQTPYIDAQGLIAVPSRGQTAGAQLSLPASFSGYVDTAYGTTSGSTGTLYFAQEANVQSSDTYEYPFTAKIDYPTSLPATGAQYTVNYSAYRVVTHHYTSGDYPGTFEAVTCSIITSNCSVVGGTSSVSGSGSFQIDVAANGGGSRFISVTIQDSGLHTGGDTKIQDGMTACAATFTVSVGGGTGRVWLTMDVTSGTPLGDTVLRSVVLHYTNGNGSYTSEVDDITITDGEQVAIEVAGHQMLFFQGAEGEIYISAVPNNISTPSFPTSEYAVMSFDPEQV